MYNQYDSTVRSNTVQGPGGDGAVIRLKGTNKGLAVSIIPGMENITELAKLLKHYGEK